MPRRTAYVIAFIGAFLILASQCFFIVHQTQKALILQLGEPMRGIFEPGIHIKLPFVQNVIYFDARILDYEARKAAEEAESARIAAEEAVARAAATKLAAEQSRAELEAEMSRLARTTGRTLRFERPARGYAQLATIA